MLGDEMKDSVATAVTKLLQDFLARDFVYVLGGFSIEICFYFLVLDLCLRCRRTHFRDFC